MNSKLPSTALFNRFAVLVEGEPLNVNGSRLLVDFTTNFLEVRPLRNSAGCLKEAVARLIDINKTNDVETPTLPKAFLLSVVESGTLRQRCPFSSLDKP
jgi:hypothetical protein